MGDRDIVERLSKEAAAWGGATHTVAGPAVSSLLTEAATLITSLREALEYARPLLVKYAYTQGNRADFVREITAPVDAVLNPSRKET